MPFWSPSATVKVLLRLPDAKEEIRRVELPSGARTRLAELLGLLEDRFGRPLASAMTYVDIEGDRLTITADSELWQALAAGAERFEVAARQLAEPEEGWEVVETARPEASDPAGVSWATEVHFWVNGEEVVVTNPSPAVTLLDWLRETRGLTGTHKGCGEGGCGICTVNLTRKDPSTGQVKQVPINSCLRRVCALDGCHVITTEGIGCQKSGFHSIQSAIATGNGSQCGFCTPGWVMGMYSLLERNRTPSKEDVERAFDGNLCRCTGYRPILTSFGTYAQGGKRCGKHTSVPHPPGVLAHTPQPLHFSDARTGQEWFRPLSMEQFREAAAQARGKRLRPVCASTADGVAKYLAKPDFSANGTVFVDVSHLPELQGTHLDPNGLQCGAAATIEDVISSLEMYAKDVPSFGVLAEHMRRIASVPIRSVASWAGNLMLTREHPSFASDMATILAAVGASFEVHLASGVQKLNVLELLSSKGDLLLLSMQIPKAASGSIFQTFKAAPRSVFSHAYVNFAAYIAVDAGSRIVSESRIFLGGACKTLLRAAQTDAVLRGRSLDQSTLTLALASLTAEIAANASTDQRSSTLYREQLATSFLYKTFLAAVGSPTALPPRYSSAIDPFVQMVARPVSGGTESFGTDPSEGPVSQYVTKRAAFIQASGEAAYPSDYGGRGALFGQLVFSTVAKARLVALDPTEALKMPGVHDFVTASAIPGVNCPNTVHGGESLKEKIFFEVNDVVPCVGAMLGIIIADSWREARDAAKRVTQRYADVGPVVGCIDDAVQLRQTVPGSHGVDSTSKALCRGVRYELTSGVEHVAAVEVGDNLFTAKGTFKTGGQKHFYMETQSVCVIPHDGNQWEVISSDQNANFTQGCLAAVLAVPMHHINVKVPRAGGGFGGKITRQMQVVCAAAVAAARLRCPVRVQNERSDDMQLVGGRQSMDFDYEVTFDASGRVDSMHLGMTMDAGWLYADSKDCMGLAVGWSDNCYQYRSFKVTPRGAITDTPANTPARAPGCMQSILAAEVVMEHIAKMVGKPVEEVQALNFYRIDESPTTPFGDRIGKDGYNWTIPTLWSQIQTQAQFAQRQASVKAYNEASRWRKKGIAISPAKYVIDSSKRVYSSGALVCIYKDGTVLVSSGGSEIGQGLTTKIALCVANALNAPFEKIQVGPLETSKVPDNSTTGGSATSECSAQAAILACQKLLPLLAPYRTDGKSWDEAVAAAAAKNVGLMASGWYQGEIPQGANNYATYGTAISEVEIDALTGEVRVDRVDILMDLGTQLDAAVDIGQIQGGFVMALGYLLTEELKVDSTGTQLHLGTWDYKIPTAYDIPLEFNVQLLKDSPNPAGIKGSKASAEPVMCLIPSVYLAVKNAIYAARREVGLGDAWFMLNIPLTPEAIRISVGVLDEQLDMPKQAS